MYRTLSRENCSPGIITLSHYHIITLSLATVEAPTITITQRLQRWPLPPHNNGSTPLYSRRPKTQSSNRLLRSSAHIYSPRMQTTTRRTLHPWADKGHLPVRLHTEVGSRLGNMLNTHPPIRRDNHARREMEHDWEVYM